MDTELDRLRRQLASVDRELERAELGGDPDLLQLRDEHLLLLARIEREQEIRRQVERAWSPERDQDLERDVDR